METYVVLSKVKRLKYLCNNTILKKLANNTLRNEKRNIPSKYWLMQHMTDFIVKDFNQ